MGDMEPYESYGRPEVKTEDNEASMPSAVPVYQPAWPQHQCSYESPISPTLANSYVNQHQQTYFHPEFASFTNGVAASQPNGYFVGPKSTAASFDDQMKGNCVAVPVAHGHGYVLYQACLGPSGDNGTSMDANDLYSAMKNLSLRPIGGIPPMSYPLAETHQVEMAPTNGPFITTVPIRPAPNGKIMQTPCNNLQGPPRSGSTPPTVVTPTSNAYLASMRAVRFYYAISLL